jgi:hypothetical protein
MEVLLRSVACYSLPRPNHHALTCLPRLPAYLRNPLMHTIGCVFSIRSTDQWIDLPPRIYRRSRFTSYLLTITNNNNQRVNNTTRLLIGLGVCILLPYLIERAGITPLTAHAFAYCHNLLGCIAVCTSGCRRGVYCNRKHGFSTAVIDRPGGNSMN